MENRVRAEPKHKLDRFTQWSRETIKANKKTGGLEKNAQKKEQEASNLLRTRH